MTILTGRQMDFEEYEEALMRAYVPDAEGLSREDALAIAIQRDKEAAETLREDRERLFRERRPNSYLRLHENCWIRLIEELEIPDGE